MDNLSKESRKKNMKAIRSISSLEDKISKALWKRGLRARRNVTDLYGKPDISLKKYKIVIFIDSCFWHSCDLHKTEPKTNKIYWKKKLTRNKERDQEVTQYYIEKGWKIMRVWEHDLRKNKFEETVDKILDFIQNAKKDSDRI